MIKFIPGFASTNVVWENQTRELSKHFPITNTVSDYIIAWSMGVFDAVRIYFENKDTVKKMVLVSGTPKFLKDDGYDHGLPPALLKNLERKMREDLEQGLRFFYGLVINKGEHPVFRKIRPPSAEKIFSDLERLRTEDIRHLLPQIDIPVLLIHGEKDQICLLEASRYMSAVIPNARLEVFKDAGHAPFLDDPKTFNRLAAGFLRCK